METTFGDLNHQHARTQKYLDDLSKVVGLRGKQKERKKTLFIPELVISDPPSTDKKNFGDLTFQSQFKISS
jgi:hypothetical protein